MRIDGLQDGLLPGHMLDVWPETTGFGRINFLADPAMPDAGAGGAPDATPPPEEPPEPEPDDVLDGDKIDEAKLKKLIEDRSRKNRLLLEEKKRADELAAKVAKLEEAENERKKAEMSEVERAKAEAEEAKAKLDAALAEKERMIRETAAVRAGVDPDLIESVSLKMLGDKLDTSDDKAVKKYFDDLKVAHPKWFSDMEPAPPAAGGHQSGNADPEAAAIQTRIDALEKSPGRTLEETGELNALRQHLARLQKE